MQDPPPPAPYGSGRARDPVRTQAEIIEVAVREFADQGYSGARVDRIAERTRTTKRMIYYYFGGKEGLYTAVLEHVYSGIRQREQALDVAGLSPIDAIRRLAELTYDHHVAHPDFIRLVSIENTHRAEHLAKSEALSNLRMPVLDLIAGILEKGRADGTIRADADAVDVHMLVSSYCVFAVANRHTFATIFARDLLDPERRGHYRSMVGELLVRYLTP
ncbi:TetR family transcriptional regulator [Murinocardiopsis flavida]|uniref:TetR family transcriptional regulator n=1 Tax=Murinocardiopsis flavida TaxID=645275 RepID=A0A2P8DUI2_9ACTN|nr:TetR/AcrR family transcriptional regulator [Murinocardiopsis flavida]PSL00888.1 TetR family transcriptional regulator [Murinocardiopsis flavida]